MEPGQARHDEVGGGCAVASLFPIPKIRGGDGIAKFPEEAPLFH